MKHFRFRSNMKHSAYAPYDLSSIALRATDDEKMENESFRLQYIPCSVILTVKRKFLMEKTSNFFAQMGKKTWSRQDSLHAPQVRFMAQRAASYGEAVLHKSLTMKHCFATAPQYEASPFHSDMKHFAYAPYDIRKWKMRAYPFAIQRYPHYIMTCHPVLYGWIFFMSWFYPMNCRYL